MSNDPVFDPVFNLTPAAGEGGTMRERAGYLFDGWSYEPLTIDRSRAARAGEPQRKVHARR
ncbi:hypothetical protein [Sphingomonas dokdonensis]|jgi:hypothetical protein|uniref:Uncharacterized protein n=1 Tax=Sphingomonas dokdonensis TaxID=344880 RepID=A0A2D0A4I5_9SPHN|nr:hypothetical protein [Sphingomonas dokdonensis]OWK27804.1 hypothetical protein SPDO_30440 [Sphingomonas dokdonensis]